MRIKSIARRDLLLTGGGAVVLATFARLESAIAAGIADHSAAYRLAFEALAVKGQPEEARVTLDLPEIAENGNTVPYKIAVDSEMTAADYVKTVHLLSTANPQATVATFYLTPLSGRAQVSGRMRLAKTQDVVVLAELSGGAIYMATRRVDVTIGGCGNE